MPDRLLAFDAHDLVNLAAIDFRTRESSPWLVFLKPHGVVQSDFPPETKQALQNTR